MINKNKLIYVMAEAMYDDITYDGKPEWNKCETAELYRSQAEVAFMALCKELPSACEVTPNEMGGLNFNFKTPASELYKQLKNIGEE